MASTGARLTPESSFSTKNQFDGNNKQSPSTTQKYQPPKRHHHHHNHHSKKHSNKVSYDEEGKIIVDAPLGSHVLTNSWTIWFMNRGPGVKISNYLDATKQLDTFSTVEEFWQIYSHLKRVDRLPFTSEFQVFRKGVKPMWEDPVNVNGGKWVFRIKRPFKLYPNHNNINNMDSPNQSLTSTPTTSHAHLSSLAAPASSADGTTTPTHQQQQKYPGNHARIYARLLWEKLLLSMIGGVLIEDAQVDSNEITGIVMSVRKDEDILSIWTRSRVHGEGNTAIRDAVKRLLELPDSQVFEFKNHSESIKEGAQKQALYNSTHANNGNINHANGILNHYNNHHNNHHNNHNHHHNNHHHSNNNGGTPNSTSKSSNYWNSPNTTSTASIVSAFQSLSSPSPSSLNSIFSQSNVSSSSLLRSSSPSPVSYSNRFSIATAAPGANRPKSP